MQPHAQDASSDAAVDVVTAVKKADLSVLDLISIHYDFSSAKFAY